MPPQWQAHAALAPAEEAGTGAISVLNAAVPPSFVRSDPDRYLALVEGPGSPRRLTPGATIAVGNTEPALDLDALIDPARSLRDGAVTVV